MTFHYHLNVLFISLSFLIIVNTDDIDSNGYIVYCPCMGRIGNQAEQLLGALQFAKSLNRTLVLPPFIVYIQFTVNFIPFDEYIKVEPIEEFHRVITMEKFMKQLSPIVWPKENRIIMCYSTRIGSMKNDCNPFEGNPFRPFWHYFNITEFDGGSQFYSPLITNYNHAEEWKHQYNHMPVLAFVGAPSAFPTNEDAVAIQQYINLSDNLAEIAKQYRETRGFTRIPYVAIHLRHGSDWYNACDLLKENPKMQQLFSSHQCTSILEMPVESLPYELCYPNFNTIIYDIKKIINGNHSPHKINTVYIATDYNNETLWTQMHNSLPNITIIAPTKTISADGVITNHNAPSPMIDAYIMSYSNHFIGNCISSFSAFVSRMRLYNLHFNKSTTFFAQNKLYKNSHISRDEL